MIRLGVQLTAHVFENPQCLVALIIRLFDDSTAVGVHMAYVQPPVADQFRYLPHSTKVAARLPCPDVEGHIRKLVVAGT